jgi:hypothetical protein
LVLRHDVTGEDLGSVECQEITLEMICVSVLKIQRWWTPSTWRDLIGARMWLTVGNRIPRG